MTNTIESATIGVETHRLLNRELSWLEFNDRVLTLATEPGIPLLERAKFCAIFSSNLDEFFQVRVAALRDQIAADIDEPSWDGRTPLQQLTEITARANQLIERQESIYLDELKPALAAEGVHIVSWTDLSETDREQMREYYDQRIFPVLTPLAVDPGHPFPYISNLALSIAAHVADPKTGESRFVRLKVPDVFDRLIELEGGRFVPSEEVVAAHLHTLFVGMVVENWTIFRVTRNADLSLEEDEADDLLEAVELELRKRRFNKVIRLEVLDSIDDEMLALLLRELNLDERNVSRHRALLDLGCLMSLLRIDRPDLKDRAWPPVTPGRMVLAEENGQSVFSVMRERAALVHHPYESFASSTEAFIEQAADDPQVQSMKMTLYRAGGDSPIIRALVRAAESGKQVAVLVELKARFDEENNVQWARQLERAGVHVVYGMVGLKTHSKTVLVVRDDGDRLRRYCHIGTGNYNSKTARIYEDLGYLTCDPDIGADATQLFNHLTGYSRSEEYRTLLVAPRDLKRQLIDLIEREAALGSEGLITLKCNSIADRDVVEALYAASAAGTRVQGIVRGICTLRAGVPGLSENISIRSILGRYLEHSRIYRFDHGADDGPVHLIGSADLMPRNLRRRVEVLVPIEHPRHREWLDQVFEFDLADDIVRWELQPDDTWLRRGPAGAFEPDAQERMYRWAVERQHQNRL
ncbi:MAG: polyphosphate kinase 1 [Ilumatobacter sp.]|uniref:polyphosphate kinase 1 n=1 Tax=Ilumatobacter sp. TaxID=1967498 RepID=UPI002620A9EC|nr:polyphosphate kinase 1 [Ilumatobacter sp.]MDJ0771219.1 polyphosphate kinase 1 [Ilumatobacter sp.]